MRRVGLVALCALLVSLLGYSTAQALSADETVETQTFVVTYTIPTVTVTVTEPTEPPPPPPSICSVELNPGDSVQTALSAATPGAVICLHAGTYLGQPRATVSGTAEQPITLRAYPGERPILTVPQGTTAVQYPLRVAADYFQIGPGLVIERSTNSNSANIWGCGPLGGCAGGTDPDFVTVVGNEIRNGCDQGIITEAESQDWRITRNWIHDHGVQNTGCNARVHQQHNIYLQGDRMLVDNNLLTTTPDGFSMQVYPYCQGCDVISNTLDNARYGSLGIGGNGQSSRTGLAGVDDLDAVNNIGARPGSWSAYCTGSMTGIRIHDNIWASASNCPLGADNPIADPLYVALGTDYHLQSGSPGIDTGDGAFRYSPDLDGTERSGLIDKGAYER